MHSTMTESVQEVGIKQNHKVIQVGGHIAQPPAQRRANIKNRLAC